MIRLFTRSTEGLVRSDRKIWGCLNNGRCAKTIITLESMTTKQLEENGLAKVDEKHDSSAMREKMGYLASCHLV